MTKDKEEKEEKVKETEEKTSESSEKVSETSPREKEEIVTWEPKTSIGRDVKEGKIKDIDEILDNGLKILEPKIVDILLPDLETDLLLVGQSKGKFGGGQRRVFRQTQKKTSEGNKPKFATMAVIGNRNGYFGVGYGKSKETVPAREKAIRNAKLNIKKIRRGCGSWECSCSEPHSIPFKITGKVGSLVIELMPAPKGTGLIAEEEIAKILEKSGIKDIWSKTRGQTKKKINMVYACLKAFEQLMNMKVQPKYIETLSTVEGKVGEK